MCSRVAECDALQLVLCGARCSLRQARSEGRSSHNTLPAPSSASPMLSSFRAAASRSWSCAPSLGQQQSLDEAQPHTIQQDARPDALQTPNTWRPLREAGVSRAPQRRRASSPWGVSRQAPVLYTSEWYWCRYRSVPMPVRFRCRYQVLISQHLPTADRT